MVYPSAGDWRTADLRSGLVHVGGRRARLLYPGLWSGCVSAQSHRLDSHAWDYSSNANHGTRTGGVADVADGWLLDGSDDLLDLGAGASLNLTADFSLMVWFREVSGGGSEVMVSRRTHATAYPYVMMMGAASTTVRLFSDNTGVESTDTYTTGALQSVAVTRAGTTITFYINGVADSGGTQSLAVGTGQASSETYIGVQHNATVFTGHHNASYVEARIYNVALPADRVQVLAERPHISYECLLI